jgi:dihydroxy-acid dehydratase
VREGDRILIDIDAHVVELLVPAAEIAARRAAFRAPQPKAASGYLARYARAVGPASGGASLNAEGESP